MNFSDMTRFACSVCAGFGLLSGCGEPQTPIGAHAILQQNSSTAPEVPGSQLSGLARAVCPQLVGRPTCLALTQKGIQPTCSGSSCVSLTRLVDRRDR